MSQNEPRALKSPQTSDETEQYSTAGLQGIEAVAPGIHRDTATGELVSDWRLEDV